MADTFLLDLVTPERTFFSGPVKELVAPGSLGEFGVLPGHANMLSELTAGRLLYKDYVGTLDATGSAAAEMRIPKIPALKGTRIYSAFVTLLPSAPLGVKNISNNFMFTIT